MPFLLLLISFMSGAAPIEHGHSEHGRVGSHGMTLLTDGQAFYASHLPLYYPPHDYQLVYKLKIKASRAMINELAVNKLGELVTMLPEHFDLNRLIEGESLVLKTDIYRGHFERGGELWLEKVNVEFTELLYKRAIGEVSVNQIAAAEYDYIELNKTHGMFVRNIMAAPSADHIIIFSKQNPGKPCLTPLSEQSLNLSELPKLESQQKYVNKYLNDCFEVVSDYWEVADFRK